jgi:hypothetical protein
MATTDICEYIHTYWSRSAVAVDHPATSESTSRPCLACLDSQPTTTFILKLDHHYGEELELHYLSLTFFAPQFFEEGP